MAKENIEWTQNDEDVLRDLGFTTESGEGKLVRGQRRINGKFFVALQTILECFQTKYDLSDEDKARVARALDLVKTVPDADPPKCEQPGSLVG
jgi:hypothetical protein